MQLAEPIIQFLRDTFAEQKRTQGVIAVSGGIDSAVSLTLLVQAIGAENVMALLLPHHTQSMDDARVIVQHNQIPSSNIVEIDIKPIVDAAATALSMPARENEQDAMRRGNLKARARMMCLFDMAKAKNALVCGTENKSEHYLGYFTRFGDAASDIEPICHLYKTQVRELAQALNLPQIFLEKAPSAGLWVGQTDEAEMGFSYQDADKVLREYIDLKKKPTEITIEGVSVETVQKVIQQVNTMKFKLEVPYSICYN
jgi:NAD+ synthase